MFSTDYKSDKAIHFDGLRRAYFPNRHLLYNFDSGHQANFVGLPHSWAGFQFPIQKRHYLTKNKKCSV